MQTLSCESVADATVSQMFDALVDVGNFEEFVPWVQSSRIDKSVDTPNGKELEGSVLVSLRTFSGWLSARVQADREQNKIVVRMTKGPFKVANASFSLAPAAQANGNAERTMVKADIEYATPLAIYRSLIDKHHKRGFDQTIAIFARRYAEAG